MGKSKGRRRSERKLRLDLNGFESSASRCREIGHGAPGFGERDEKSARRRTSSSAVASFSRADREVCTTMTILSVGEAARHARPLEV